ncbi:MAG: hypothetical protein IT442_15660 [Phycisphaeraceae bacterium]|nr:hypothetical protein [Phycisphaeraceae bacterium]
MRYLIGAFVCAGVMAVAFPAQAKRVTTSDPTGCSVTAPCDPTDAGPLSVILDLNDNKDTQIKISFVSEIANVWTYKVEELEGRDLSHWLIDLGDCLRFVVGTSTGATVGPDGSTGYSGIKWNTPDSFSSGEFSFTMDKDYGPGTVLVLAKAGDGFVTGEIYGPDCCELQIVPLPAAAWSGLAALGALAAFSKARKIRKA